MSEIRIDADKAERMIAQTLRDDYGLLPAQANAAAEHLCRRLRSAMPTPGAQQLARYRMISRLPPHGSGFKEAVAEKIADVNDRVAMVLWELVWDRSQDLPPTVAEAQRY